MNNELVVSNIAMVLQEHLNLFESRMPEINSVYDESLSYETAIAKYRADNDMGEHDDISGAMPLFIFNRSVLRYSPNGLGRRSVTHRPCMPSDIDGESIIYRSLHGQIEVPFMFVSTRMVDIENFEISYMSEESVGGDKEILVDHDDLGTFPYYVHIEPLEDLRVNIDGNYYKGVTGRSTITGWYFTLKGTAKVIKEIGLRVMDFNRAVFVDETIQ